MTNIQYLLQKYEKPTPAEKYTNKYQNRINTEKARKHRHLILDTLINEIPFTLKEYQIQQIRYWIDQFNKDFKNLHRQSTNETIILALIFIQYKHTNKRIETTEYSISKKYNLTDKKFKSIQNQLIFTLMKTTPLQYNQKTYLDNDIEDKKGT